MSEKVARVVKLALVVLVYSDANDPPSLSALLAVPQNLYAVCVTPLNAFCVSLKVIPWRTLSNPAIAFSESVASIVNSCELRIATGTSPANPIITDLVAALSSLTVLLNH